MNPGIDASAWHVVSPEHSASLAQRRTSVLAQARRHEAPVSPVLENDAQQLICSGQLAELPHARGE